MQPFSGQDHIPYGQKARFSVNLYKYKATSTSLVYVCMCYMQFKQLSNLCTVRRVDMCMQQKHYLCSLDDCLPQVNFLLYVTLCTVFFSNVHIHLCKKTRFDTRHIFVRNSYIERLIRGYCSVKLSAYYFVSPKAGKKGNFVCGTLTTSRFEKKRSKGYFLLDTFAGWRTLALLGFRSAVFSMAVLYLLQSQPFLHLISQKSFSSAKIPLSRFLFACVLTFILKQPLQLFFYIVQIA